MKKLITVFLTVVSLFCISVSCFADTYTDAVPFKSKTDTSYVLNAYTSTTPISGTKVSVYPYDGSDTQKFYTNGGYLFCAANGANPTLRVAYSYRNAIFRPVTYDYTLAHMSATASSGYYVFSLDYIENEYTTLTAPLDYTRSTNQVTFQMYSGLNSQKWRLN